MPQLNIIPGIVQIDLSDWLRGLVGAFVSGGSNAIVAGFSVGAVDPKDFALGSTNSFHVMGLMFLFSGILGGAAFLSKRPVPDLKQITSTEKTINTDSETGAKTVSIKTEVHQEPINQEKKDG